MPRDISAQSQPQATSEAKRRKGSSTPACPQHLLVLLTGNGSATFTMALPASVSIEKALGHMSSICEASTPASGQWEWLADPLVAAGYQLDFSGLLLHSRRYSAVVEVKVLLSQDAYGIECWSRSQEMYAGEIAGDIAWAPDAIGRESLLRKINWSHLPEEECIDGNALSPDASKLEWDINEACIFESELERLRMEFAERKESLPAGKQMMLSELFADCDRLLEDYRRYELHPSFFLVSLLEEDKALSASILHRIESILNGPAPLPPSGNIGGLSAEGHAAIEMEQWEEAIGRAADATGDMRFVTEYAGYRYGSSPFSGD